MQTIEEIIKQARRLSLKDRRRLVEELEALVAEESETGGPSADGPYARSLSLAGTAHTEFHGRFCRQIQAPR